MKTKLFLSTICALLLSLTCSGATSLATLTPSEKPLNSAMAIELLEKVYMHHQALLSNAEVKIIDAQTSERFMSIGGKSTNGIRTIMICSVKHDNFPTEYYAVTFNGNDIADGTLLGYNGDSEILKIKTPRDEIIYQPKYDIDIEFHGDTIKVQREYLFFTTANGGRWFNKEGTICNPFVVSSSGTIKQLSPIATAIREDGDANYLSEDHQLPTRSKTSGEFFPLGMNVLTMAQTPANYPLNTEELNKNVGSMMKIIEQYDENAPKNPETLSAMEYIKWSFNLGMRHSNEFLTWIAKNPKNEKFTHLIQDFTSESENNEVNWLKENVKNLKNKKARKWWQKWMKENLENK